MLWMIWQEETQNTVREKRGLGRRSSPGILYSYSANRLDIKNTVVEESKPIFFSCNSPKWSILKRVGNKISKLISGGRESSFLYLCIPPFQRLRTGSDRLRTSALKLCMIPPVSACIVCKNSFISLETTHKDLTPSTQESLSGYLFTVPCYAVSSADRSWKIRILFTFTKS